MDQATSKPLPTTDTDSGQADALAEQIRHHRQLYYNSQPEISDAEFDALEDRLRALAPQHPVLGEVGAAPTAEVTTKEKASAKLSASPEAIDSWAEELKEASDRAYLGKLTDPKLYKQLYKRIVEAAPDHPLLAHCVVARGLEWPKVAHEIPMGSLNKVNAEQELQDWITRCDELGSQAELKSIAGDLSVTEKLDGISIEVLYDHGKYEAAITRGDGTIGERISPNVMRMQGVPQTITHQGRISVRGEIILRKSNAPKFEAFKKEVDKKFDGLKSLRNTASGIARTKDHKQLPACAFLTVLFYDLEGIEGLQTEKDKLDFLQKQGFGRPFMGFGDNEEILTIYRRYSDTDRAKLDYEIDGLVVRANDLHSSTLLGEKNHRPRAAVAFKFSNEMQVTLLKDILWSTGDTGRITPVAQIEPVFLAGAEVKQASLHNLGNVKNLGIGIGDQVLVSRRNDVIPYVEKVVVKGKNNEEGPAQCSICQTDVVVDGEYLVCPNLDCPARRQGRIKTWIKQLGLLEWGEKTLETFYNEGLAKTVADLYRLEEEQITALYGFGKDTAQKLLGPLNDNKQIPLPTFIAALGIPAVAKSTGKLLVEAGFVEIKDIVATPIEKLAEIEGLGEIKAEKIISGLKSRLEEIEELASLGVVPTKPDDSGPLAGMSFCFSGSHHRPRKVLAKMVEDNGGTVSSSVKKGLNYLVLADRNSTSSKAQKARKLGTEVIDGETFEALVVEKGGKVDV